MDTIAIVYDFDGTLTPQPMQDYTVLPELGVEPARFWADVDAEAERTGGDPMLTYLRLLLERMHERGRPISRQALRRLGARIRYFPGVDSWYPRIADYLDQRGGVRLRNYILSAGQREILEGIAIRHHFARIFASEYFFDERGIATFPNRVVNDATKTQYLFRINKGIEDVRHSINTHMPEDARPVPFSNMLYIGDGMTDVPGMTVTKKNGGYAAAVYRPDDADGRRVCQELLEAGRIDFHAPADFRAGSLLERRVMLVLDVMTAHIRYRRQLATDQPGEAHQAA
jgi:phosphoserine phosphatase